jgi:hypothetical protein
VLAVALTGVTATARQTFRMQVDAVGIPVSVRHEGVLVQDLAAGEFQVFDNGVEQTVTAVSSGSTPLDVTVVLDTSGSVAGNMFERLTAEARATDVLTADDRLRLLTFRTTVHEALPLSPVHGTPLAPGLEAGGATAFLHAVIAALLSATDPGRPHIVVALSDGLDNVSLLGVSAVRELVRYSNVALYVVLPGVQRLEQPAWRPVRPNVSGAQRTRTIVIGWTPFWNPGDLRKLRDAAESTGGSLTTPPEDQPPGESLRQVLAQFRSGYVLWFTPTGVERGGWHDLTVRVTRPDHEVQARQGYFAR